MTCIETPAPLRDGLSRPEAFPEMLSLDYPIWRSADARTEWLVSRAAGWKCFLFSKHGLPNLPVDAAQIRTPNGRLCVASVPLLRHAVLTYFRDLEDNASASDTTSIRRAAISLAGPAAMVAV